MPKGVLLHLHVELSKSWRGKVLPVQRPHSMCIHTYTYRYVHIDKIYYFMEIVPYLQCSSVALRGCYTCIYMYVLEPKGEETGQVTHHLVVST